MDTIQNTQLASIVVARRLTIIILLLLLLLLLWLLPGIQQVNRGVQTRKGKLNYDNNTVLYNQLTKIKTTF